MGGQAEEADGADRSQFTHQPAAPQRSAIEQTVFDHGFQMTAISIRHRAANGALALDLVDLLRLAGPAVATTQWTCRGVEAVGHLAEDLHRASDHGDIVDGRDLLRIAAGVSQVIDGEFQSVSAPSVRPWLRILAIDSTEFVVITSDAGVLARIRAAYHDLHESPDDDA
jgi:hypothetical protein